VLAVSHEGDGQADEHLLALAQSLDGVGISVELSEIGSVRHGGSFQPSRGIRVSGEVCRRPRTGVKSAATLWKTVVPLMLSLLVGCAGLAGVEQAPDLSTLSIDPQSFTRITLRDGVKIETAVIHSGAARPGVRWVVVQYVEQENRKGFVPQRESEYANLYLVGEVQGGGADGGVLRDRYLVAELWRYDPGRGIKTCHQWTIWEDETQSGRRRASFRLLVEDFGNVLLGERQIEMDGPTLERLGQFSIETKRSLLRRVKDLGLQRPA
jgi:hypothetical protein